MADDAKAYVNTNAPAGGNTSPIRLTHTTLRGIADKGTANLKFMQDSAPGEHQRLLQALGAKTGVEADLAIAASAEKKLLGEPISRPKPMGGVITSIFAKGEIVRDTTLGKKVTILRLNAAYTPKGRPMHKVARNGQVWLQKESKLEKL